jgi:hypothetical protein
MATRHIVSREAVSWVTQTGIFGGVIAGGALLVPQVQSFEQSNASPAYLINKELLTLLEQTEEIEVFFIDSDCGWMRTQCRGPRYTPDQEGERQKSLRYPAVAMDGEEHTDKETDR